MENIANRNNLAERFTGTGAEIGVYRGEFSEVINQYATKLYCIDPYREYLNHKQADLDSAYKQAKERLPNAEFVRASSMEAIGGFNDNELDFVYIDGDHSFIHIAQDLYWWARKVRRGGIVAGHDYFVSDWDKSVVHVVPVVDAYCQAFRITLNVTGEQGVRENSPSWWFVK